MTDQDVIAALARVIKPGDDAKARMMAAIIADVMGVGDNAAPRPANRLKAYIRQKAACEQGQTEEATGCTPANKPGGKPGGATEPTSDVTAADMEAAGKPPPPATAEPHPDDDYYLAFSEPEETAPAPATNAGGVDVYALDEHLTAVASWETVEKKLGKDADSVLDDVIDYTGEGYKSLNAAMRQCPPDFKCLKGRQKRIYDSVERAIAAVPPLKEPVFVYRGIKFSKAAAAEMVKMAKAVQAAGKVYQMPCITSTTIDRNMTSGFMRLSDDGVVMRIKTRRGLYAEPITENRTEMELITSGRARYKVVNVSKEDFGGKYHDVIHLEEIE